MRRERAGADLGVELRTESRRNLHGVHFYTEDEQLVALVSDYVADALASGDPAVVIATPEHTRAILGAVTRRAATAARDVLWLDAAETLGSMMVDGHPDPVRFDETVASVIRGAAAAGGHPAAFGEMVALLWASGDVVAAIELEELWNGLLVEQGFSLICAYPSECVRDGSHEGVRRICGVHSEVLGEPLTTLYWPPDGPPADVEHSFRCDATAARDARELLTETLSRWGIPELAGDGRAVVSELVANAVRHARTQFRLTISARPDTIRIAVSDGSSLVPTIAEPREESGRGLVLVDALSTRWGVESKPGGKVVWADLGLVRP